MSGQNIGYIRVSSLDQKFERQLEGMNFDHMFTDKASGKDTQREQLDAMIKFSQKGDAIYVHSMDRLARNLDDLRKLVKEFTENGVAIHFVKEHLTFTGEDSPMANLMLSVMGAFAEFERSLIKERQREGIALAKKRGIYKGRKPCLTKDDVILLKSRVGLGDKKSDIARDLGISRETLYQYLRLETEVVSEAVL
jgi:DNA invertase Pin-like site-specific DNA recombinase